MAVFKEVEIDGKTHGTITVDFNVGEIVSEKNESDGVTIAMTIATEWGLNFYSQRMFEVANEGNREHFNELLEQYRQYVMLDTIGVTNYPLKRTVEGELVGLEEDVEKQ